VETSLYTGAMFDVLEILYTFLLRISRPNLSDLENFSVQGNTVEPLVISADGQWIYVRVERGNKGECDGAGHDRSLVFID
jgi:hypothetical protein